MNARTNPLALYVHWPFCVSKCPYCDFNSHVRAERRPGGVARRRCSPTCAHEAALLPGRRLGSIFFGGGTPSLMPPATVAAVIDAARARTGASPTTSRSRWRRTRRRSRRRASPISPRAGVNRVSLGLQALDDAALRFLGRAHDVGRGAGRARHRASGVRAGQLRPDLCAARPVARRRGRPNWPARWRSGPSICRSTS